MYTNNMHDKKLYGTATVGTKGQVVIPAEARDALNIKPGDKLYVIGSQGKQAIGFIKEEQLEALVSKFVTMGEEFSEILQKNK